MCSRSDDLSVSSQDEPVEAAPGQIRQYAQIASLSRNSGKKRYRDSEGLHDQRPGPYRQPNQQATVRPWSSSAR